MTSRGIDEKIHYGFKACPVAKEQITEWNRTKRRNRVYKAINTGLKERDEIK